MGSALTARLAALTFAVCTSACSRGESRHTPGPKDAASALLDAATLARLEPLALSQATSPPDATNRFADDPAAAAFGQKLFFYPGFAGPLLESDHDATPGTLGKRGDTGRVACASCHVPKDGFVDTRSRGQQISLGAEWGIRRAPSLLNVAQRRLLTWVGKADTFFAQALTVFEDVREMNSSRLFVAHQVYRDFRADYESLFGPLPPLEDATRFPRLRPEHAGCDRKILDRPRACRGRPGDGGPYDSMTAVDQHEVNLVVANVGKALGAYLRRLSCGPGRFDAFVSGNRSALNQAEQRGAALFVGRAGCVKCHNGPYFSDFQFHNIGLRPTPVAVAFVDAGDRGAFDGLVQARENTFNSRSRYSDGKNPTFPERVDQNMLGAFQTPMLRCTSVNPSYMHTGQFRSLEAVVSFFDAGGDYSGYPGKSELVPLRLSQNEKRDLVAFLRALDGTPPPAELLTAPEPTSAAQ